MVILDHKRTSLIFSLIVFLLLIGGAAVLYINAGDSPRELSSGEYIVEIRKDGFYPAELTIQKGDTVTFVPVEEGEYWPASDPHPMHNFLSGFDPQRPIESGLTWSFVFQEADIWRYHDHLNVASRGTIIVTGSNLKNENRLRDDCLYNDEARCFDEKIRGALENKGIEGAFALFADLYKKGEAPASCHWTAHLIGEEVYRNFREGGDFTPTRATSYCTWGFYHGFMETLLRDDRDLNKAAEFCQLVGDKLGWEAKDNCYHGIGHGFTDDPPHPSNWGDVNALLAPVLGACEKLLGDTINKWEICSTGGYSVLVGFMADGKYGFSLNKKDPFDFCRAQPDRYQRACYGEVAPRLDALAGWDVSKIGGFIKNIENQEQKELVVRVASGTMMQRDIVKNDLTNYIEGCRILSIDLQETCIDGIVWGLLYHGPPEREYEKPLLFCASQAFLSQERDFCYESVFSRIEKSYPYTEEKMRSICESVPMEYITYCKGNE